MSFAGGRESTSSRRMYEDSSGRVCMTDACSSLTLELRSVFNDFGTDFACVDPTGENPQTGMVVSVEEVSLRCSRLYWVMLMNAQDEDATVTCLDETRHGLEDGDFVTFSEIKGMEALNGCEPRKVTTKGMYPIRPSEAR